MLDRLIRFSVMWCLTKTELVNGDFLKYQYHNICKLAPSQPWKYQKYSILVSLRPSTQVTDGNHKTP